MGMFDLSDPAFHALDAGLGGELPPLARLVVWGVLGARHQVDNHVEGVWSTGARPWHEEAPDAP